MSTFGFLEFFLAITSLLVVMGSTYVCFPKRKTVHVAFHYPCLDGLTSVVLLMLKYPSINFVLLPYSHGDKEEFLKKIKDKQPKTLIFLDVTPSPELHVKLGFVREIMVIDHHRRGFSELLESLEQKYPEQKVKFSSVLGEVFPNEISPEKRPIRLFQSNQQITVMVGDLKGEAGVGVLWGFIHRHEKQSPPLPLVIQTINNADIWNMGGKTFLIIVGINLIFQEQVGSPVKSNFDLKKGIGFIKTLFTLETSEFLQRGQEDLDRQMTLVIEAFSKGVKTDSGLFVFLPSNEVCPNGTTLLTKHLTKQTISYPAFVLYPNPQEGGILVTCASRAGSSCEIDLSLLMKKLGGGGHKKAAGGALLLTWQELLLFFSDKLCSKFTEESPIN